MFLKSEVIAEIFNYTAEFVMPTRTSNTNIETKPLTAEIEKREILK